MCIAHYDADGKAKHLVLAYIMRCTVCPTSDREEKKSIRHAFFLLRASANISCLAALGGQWWSGEQ